MPAGLGLSFEEPIGIGEGAGRSRQDHDPLNRLVLMGYTGSTLTPGGTACATDSEVTQALARFQYDSRNRRVAKQVSGQWTHTVFDLAGNPLSELARTGDPVTPWVKVRDYVWLDGRLLAQVEYDGVGQGHVYYAHLDHLGMPRALTNANGQLVWSTFQRPNGEVGEKTVADPLTGSTVVTNVRLPGQYDERLFAAAGLGLQGPYYNWNRWYLPAAGRYLEADPIAMGGGFNGAFGADWYGYAGANPTTFFDQDGWSKTQNLWGNDQAYKEFLDAARSKSRNLIDELYAKYKAMWENGEMSKQRWDKIRGWWKTAKDGRILRGPLLFIIDPEIICGPRLERCGVRRYQCEDGA